MPYVIASGLKSDLQVFKWYLNTHFEAEYRAAIPDGDLEWKFDRIVERAIKPFVVGGHTLALHLTPELAEDFHGARPPETTEFESLLEQHEAVYINLPPRAYFINDGLYLSGIFILKFEHQVDNPERRKVLVSLSRPGSDQTVTLIFDLGDRDQGVPLVAGLDSLAFEEEIEAIIKLSLLYYLSKSGPVETLPEVSDEQIAKIVNPKKQRNRLREATLFKVINLKSPEGRFGRAAQERMPASGWKIGVRTKVRGHFRWQPHGPAKSLRRLQWIGSFERGPIDAHQQTTLFRMESKGASST